MSISELEFNSQCIKFIKRCQQIDNNWNLFEYTLGQLQEIDAHSFDDNERHHYRAKKLMLRKIDINSIDGLLQSNEYTVVYSDSYEVPVLYYCISDQDGCPMPVDKFHNLSIMNFDGIDLSQALTQVEHPILFRPFYMIHPCRTKDFMQSLNVESQGNYLITWLSTIATIINLKLDLKLFINYDKE